MYSDHQAPFFELPPSGNADAVPASGDLGNSTYPATFPQALTLNIWKDGSIVETSRTKVDDLPTDFEGKHTCGPRGQVYCLTSSARRRLSATVAKLRRDAPCHFITLTYPGRAENWSPELSEFGPPVPLPGPRQSKQDLRAYFKWIRRHFPNFSAVWKLEPQERGVPHFHLLAYGLPDDQALMLSLRNRWHEQVGRGHAYHYAHGFESDYLGTDADKARAYVSKYVAKGDALSLNPDHGAHAGRSPGRFWGLEFRDSLPFSDCTTMQIHPDFAGFAIRTIRRMQQAKMRQSFIKRVGNYVGSYFSKGCSIEIGLYRDVGRDLKFWREGARNWTNYPNFPKYRDPFRFVQLMRNNFTKDPSALVSKLLDAVDIMASCEPPDKLAGPRGRLP